LRRYVIDVPNRVFTQYGSTSEQWAKYQSFGNKLALISKSLLPNRSRSLARPIERTSRPFSQMTTQHGELRNPRPLWHTSTPVIETLVLCGASLGLGLPDASIGLGLPDAPRGLGLPDASVELRPPRCISWLRPPRCICRA